MELDPATLDRRSTYALLTACVVPRPIGWVSTLAPGGVPNLAPFSFFGAVSTDPPTLMLSVGRRRGQRKDTAANLLALPEAVVHIPEHRLGAAMVESSAEVGPEVDEFELAGLTRAASVRVSPPRVAEAAIALEVKVVQHQEVGRGPNDLFLLEVVYAHLRDALLDASGWPEAGALAALGRLGGDRYCVADHIIEIERPRKSG